MNRRHREFLHLSVVGLCLLTLGNANAQEKPLRQIIDAEIKAAWQREKITPAAKAGDAAFLRRIYLDLVRHHPHRRGGRQFLKDTDAKKREKLIDVCSPIRAMP